MATDPRQLLLEQRSRLWDILNSAVQELGRHDGYLLRTDLKEEAVNHRLAIYLERAITADRMLAGFGFATDCEYDKFGLDDKTVPNTWDPADMPDRPRDRRLRPDIIVHQRGNEPGGINLLTVEVKKSSTVNNLAWRYALWKSEAYRSSNLAYIFAACVCLHSGDAWSQGRALRDMRLFPELVKE